MAYSHTWSVSIPAGTLPANQIDTAIQQTRLDLQERCNTIIGSGGSMSSDPVIDGTTVKSLTDLTTAVNSKTTLSGLTTGKLIKATGASAVGNSAYSESDLTTALATLVVVSNKTITTVHTTSTTISGSGSFLISSGDVDPNKLYHVSIRFVDVFCNGGCDAVGQVYDNETTPNVWGLGFWKGIGGASGNELDLSIAFMWLPTKATPTLTVQCYNGGYVLFKETYVDIRLMAE
jgi:hypothetical protein